MSATELLHNRAREARLSPWKAFLKATEIDPRLIGMIGALALIWIGFAIASHGIFLSPRNLWNLSVQTASWGVMAAGMVLIIVMRHIDLSVGAVLGFIGMVVSVLQARFLPGLIGFDHPLTWVIVLIAGIAIGLVIGAFHGLFIAYCGIPAFIVTLGGLRFWRNAAWAVTSGQTVAPVDSRFRLIGGGGPDAAIGATASWIVGLLVCAVILAALVFGRRQRARFGFPQRPAWAEALLAVLCCGGVLGFVAIVNAYPWPPALAHRYADEHGIPWPDGGLFFAHGIAIPVLIALGVAIAVNFLATRTRFGRYVFAAGGNPEAAELGGIDTKWVTTKVFMLMGALTAISAAIATARLASATNSAGTSDELYVIAATVIGGTSLAGGSGTVGGAMIGALVMASLQSGMGLLGIDTPYQSMVIGIVLVMAVFVDTLYRRKLI